MKRLPNVDVIRCYAILTLVLWHSLCVYVGWQSYLPDVTIAVENTFLTKFYSFFTRVVFIPDANMPLFTVVSGYVYSSLQREGRYNDTVDFIKKKIKRLVAPYFIIGTIVVFTIADWEPIRLLYGEAHHLWFCAMLFWCFAFIRIYTKTPIPVKIIIILISLYFQIFTPTQDVLGFIKGVKYLSYFIMGFYLVDLLPKILSIKYVKLYAVTLWIVMILLSISHSILYLALNFFYPLMIFILIPQDIKAGKYIVAISTYSFGIYVFHEWFLWNIAHIKELHPFIIEHQVWYPLIAFVSILSLSILLTYFSLKTKVGRFLLAS